MDDIAAVFHWGPDVFDAMEIEDLIERHSAAIKRYKLMNGMKTDE